jgi:hypothetical protein
VERYFRRTRDPVIAKLVLETVPSYRGERLWERLPLYEEVLRATTERDFAKTVGRLDFLRVKATVDAAPDAELRGSMVLSLWETVLLQSEIPAQVDLDWFDDVVRGGRRYMTDQKRSEVNQRVGAMLARETAGANRQAHVAALQRLLDKSEASEK